MDKKLSTKKKMLKWLNSAEHILKLLVVSSRGQDWGRAAVEMEAGCFVARRFRSLSWHLMKSRTVLTLILGRGIPALDSTLSSNMTCPVGPGCITWAF